MTYQRHESITVVSPIQESVDAIIAFRETMPTDVRYLFVGPVMGSNGYQSFVFMPDGRSSRSSREDSADEWRENLKAFLPTIYCDWVHVQITEDSGMIRGENGQWQPFKPFVVAWGRHRGDDNW
jgi:hypothetical protein